MKNVPVIFFLFIAGSVIFSSFMPNEVVNDGEEINWMTWEEAYEANQKSPRKIFVDVYTDWCGWCKRMDATTFVDQGIVEYMNENFYAVKFNAEQKEDVHFSGTTFKWVDAGRRGIHQLAYALLDGQLSYPSYVFLDETFARIMISPGFKQPNALLKELRYAGESKYKVMSFTDYKASGK